MRPPPSASSPLAPFADARKPKVSWAETAGEEGGIRLPKTDEGVHVPLRSLNPHWPGASAACSSYWVFRLLLCKFARVKLPGD